MNINEELNKLSAKVIGCAIEVHKQLGPGLLESIYQNAMCVEFELNMINFHKELTIPVIYKGRKIGEHRIDLIVEDEIILELKCVNRNDPIFEAQLLSYLKLTGKRLGLLINFNTLLLKDGIKRLIM